MTPVHPAPDGADGFFDISDVSSHSASGLAARGLVRLAAVEPDAPWLFFRSGFDWQWRGAADAVAAIARRAATLAQRHAAAARLGYRWTPTVDALELDLAIRQAGFAAGPDAAAPEVDATAEAMTVEEAGGAFGPASGDGAAAAGSEAGGEAAGGVLVTRGAAPLRVGEAALAGAARELLACLGPLRERPVVVVSRSPRAAGERLVLAMALEAGAAIVLADAATRAGALAWARPHLVHGTAEELLAIGSALRQVRPRWRRVRGVVVLGEEPLPEAERRAWESAGATVVAARALTAGEPARHPTPVGENE